MLQLCNNNQNSHRMAAGRTECVLFLSVTKHECMQANFAELDLQNFSVVKLQGHTSAG